MAERNERTVAGLLEALDPREALTRVFDDISTRVLTRLGAYGDLGVMPQSTEGRVLSSSFSRQFIERLAPVSWRDIKADFQELLGRIAVEGRALGLPDHGQLTRRRVVDQHPQEDKPFWTQYTDERLSERLGDAQDKLPLLHEAAGAVLDHLFDTLVDHQPTYEASIEDFQALRQVSRHALTVKLNGIRLQLSNRPVPTD